jgi:phage terminase large subunit-like protein
MTNDQEKKQRAIEIIRRRYAEQREQVASIEPRLEEYFDDLCNHSSATGEHDDRHNLYELLGAVKFLRLLRTYEFNQRKFISVLRLREGQWRKDERGVWHHVSGGLKCPGTTGPTVYRWQPFQVFVLASVFGFYADIDTRLTVKQRDTLLPSEHVDEDGHIIDRRRLCTDFTFYAPRKTDKTGLSAFIQFVFFFFEDDNAEIYCCANSSDQAKLLYRRVRSLLAQMDSGNRIRQTETVCDWRQAYKGLHDSSIRPLSAGGKTKDGMFAQLCCADEF